MNPILAALRQALLLLSKYLPENVQGLVAWAADLIGGLTLPATDPKVGLVAEMVAGLLEDLDNLSTIEDAELRDKARLVAENRFAKLWLDSGLAGGGRV